MKTFLTKVIRMQTMIEHCETSLISKWFGLKRFIQGKQLFSLPRYMIVI